VPSDFVLYGGTALALQHQLQSRLPLLRDLDPAAGEGVWVHHKQDNLEGYVQCRGGTGRIAFLGGIENLRRAEDPRRPVGSRVQGALLSHGIDIPTALAAARAIDTGFQPQISLRALRFYGDGTLARVSAAMQRDLTHWANGSVPGRAGADRAEGGLV
jgi:hypothetical protein